MAKFVKSIVFLLILSTTALCQAALPLWSKTDVDLDVNVIKVDGESQLVLLNKGTLDNFGIGAYCDMSLGEEEATLVVVASEAQTSVAMKLADFQVEQGDTFRLKLINK